MDNLSNRISLIYWCGYSIVGVLLVVCVKMLFAFLMAFVVSICIAELTMFIGLERQNIVMTRENFYLSALIVFGLYIVAITIGFVKFVKAKPLKVISLEKK